LLSRLQVFTKAATTSRNVAVRKLGGRSRLYTLKRLALLLSSQGDRARALQFARQALTSKFTLKWLAAYLWLLTTASTSGSRRKLG